MPLIKDTWVRDKRLTINVLSGMTLSEASALEGLSTVRARQITATTLNRVAQKVKSKSGSDISYMYSRGGYGSCDIGWAFDLKKARRFRDHLVPIVFNTLKPKHYKQGG